MRFHVKCTSAKQDFPTQQKTSWQRHNDVSLHVSATSQVRLKWNTTSRWNFAKTSQWHVSTTSYWNVVTTSQENVTTLSHQYVFTTSRTSLKLNIQRRLIATSPRRLNGTYPRLSISTFLRRLLQIPNETPNNVTVVRLHHVLTYVAATPC